MQQFDKKNGDTDRKKGTRQMPSSPSRQESTESGSTKLEAAGAIRSTCFGAVPLLNPVLDVLDPVRTYIQ